MEYRSVIKASSNIILHSLKVMTSKRGKNKTLVPSQVIEVQYPLSSPKRDQNPKPKNKQMEET